MDYFFYKQSFLKSHAKMIVTTWNYNHTAGVLV